MPTYEYRCPAGHEFERFYRNISDAAPGVTCPECGKVAERFMSAGGGFAFKGSGFYLTDYGRNAHRGVAPKSDSSGGDGASASTESSTASKESSSESRESSSGPKESSSSAKETSGSKDTGASAKGSSGRGDSKPAPANKPAESKSSSESKPAKSGGSKRSKDK